MDRRALAELLQAVAAGAMDPSEALESLARLPVADLGFARLDTHRALRTGVPEAAYSPGKTPAQLREILRTMLAKTDGPVIATKATDEHFAAVRDLAGDDAYDPVSRTIVARRDNGPPAGSAAVVAAGTSDLPIAEEAAVCAEAFGLKIERLTDVGVAGLHRLLDVQDRLQAADVVIVVAGMEGALPSVVGGLVAAPIVAVPTSVGYGASFGGLAALLGMMNSCSPGIAVVNIDNGFGAAALAARILRRAV